MFSSIPKTNFNCLVAFILLSASSLNLDWSKILLFGKELSQRKKSFENIVRKVESAGNQHFLLFPQCFLPIPKQILIFQSNIFYRLQMR